MSSTLDLSKNSIQLLCCLFIYNILLEISVWILLQNKYYNLLVNNRYRVV